MTDTNKLYDIFISYSRKDAEVMQKIRDEFIASGIRVWTDEIYLDVGTEDWLKEIKKAIKNSCGMVVICSPSSEQSKWVGIEISLASENDLIIIPYWVEGENATDSIATLITNYQRIDARSDKFGKITELVKSVKKRLNIGDVKPQPTAEPQLTPEPESISEPQQVTSEPRSESVIESEAQPISTPKPKKISTSKSKKTSTSTPKSESASEQQQVTSEPEPAPIPNPQPTPDIRQLKAKNPIYWIILLWWILVTPDKIKTYKEQYGYNKTISNITYNYSGLEPVGNWLFSTLLCSPFIISYSTVLLGLVPLASKDIASYTPPILLSVVILLWVIIGLFGYQLGSLFDSPSMGSLIIISSIFVVGLIVGISSIVIIGIGGIGVLTISVGYSVIVGIVGGGSFISSGSISGHDDGVIKSGSVVIGIGSVIGISIAIIINSGIFSILANIIFMILFSLSFSGFVAVIIEIWANKPNDEDSEAILIISFIVAFIFCMISLISQGGISTVDWVPPITDWGNTVLMCGSSFLLLALIWLLMGATGYLVISTTWGGKLALFALPLIYAFLIWVYYFDGWRVFMPATS